VAGSCDQGNEPYKICTAYESVQESSRVYEFCQELITEMKSKQERTNVFMREAKKYAFQLTMKRVRCLGTSIYGSRRLCCKIEADGMTIAEARQCFRLSHNF